MQNFIIYTPDFSNYHEIAEMISVSYSVYYNAIGKISIVLPLTEYNSSISDVDCLVLDKENNFAFWIMDKKIDTVSNQLTLNGYTANYLLNKRVASVARRYNENNGEQSTYDLVRHNLRGLPIANAPIKNLDGSVEGYLIGGYLCDRVIEIIKVFNWGHRVFWDLEKKQFVFEIYQGRDLTSGEKSAVFSTEHGTAKNLLIDNNIATMRNVFSMRGIFIDAKGIDDNIVVSIGATDTTGAKRQEIWVNEAPIQNVRSIDNIDPAIYQAFKNRLILRLKEETGKHLQRENFSIDIDSGEFGKLYQLGDTISCVSNEFNIKFNKTIEGIKYKLDARGKENRLILGEPSLNVIEQIKLG